MTAWPVSSTIGTRYLAGAMRAAAIPAIDGAAMRPAGAGA
jgi:hypothetical protein